MKHFELDGYFASMVGGGDVENLKPAPDGVFEILNISGMDASQAWMVGDHHTDIAVAHNAGISSAYAEYGFGDKLDLEAQASFVSFEDLVRFFI